MRIIFLVSTKQDSQWFRFYYKTVFPQGSLRASKHMQTTLDVLKANPFIGAVGGEESVREIQITRTPFALQYRVTKTHIEIIRIRDQRRDEKKSD